MRATQILTIMRLILVFFLFETLDWRRYVRVDRRAQQAQLAHRTWHCATHCAQNLWLNETKMKFIQNALNKI